MITQKLNRIQIGKAKPTPESKRSYIYKHEFLLFKNQSNTNTGSK